jgi:hypothetical protein
MEEWNSDLLLVYSAKGPTRRRDSFYDSACICSDFSLPVKLHWLQI